MKQAAKIPGYPGYYATASGRVWRAHKGRLYMVPTHAAVDGYRALKLKHETAGFRSMFLHSLVALAFHGPRPRGLQVRHLDGNRLNNTADNLAYGSPLQNARDALRHGTLARGQAVPQSKLTDLDVRWMRAYAQAGVRVYQIARAFRVSWQSAWRVVTRQTWTHVYP